MKKGTSIARLLLHSNAVSLRPDNPFRYASGILSPIYCDNRILISLPDKRGTIIESFIQTISDNKLEFEVVAGTATAGIPHAAWISDRLKKPMIYARQAPKNHGKKSSIEGILDKGQKVLIIEDLISTGKSAIETIKTVRAFGGVVLWCIAIFTYEMKKAKKAFKDANCKLFTLTDFTTLTDIAVKEGFISMQDQKVIRDWNQDPEGWGRKMGFE